MSETAWDAGIVIHRPSLGDVMNYRDSNKCMRLGQHGNVDIFQFAVVCARHSRVKTFISCYRTPGPQNGFQKGFLKGFLKGFRRVLEGL